MKCSVSKNFYFNFKNNTIEILYCFFIRIITSHPASVFLDQYLQWAGRITFPQKYKHDQKPHLNSNTYPLNDLKLSDSQRKISFDNRNKASSGNDQNTTLIKKKIKFSSYIRKFRMSSCKVINY